MDRHRKTLKAGVVGLNPEEQRQVRGGRVASSLRSYRYYLSYQKRVNRNDLLWMSRPMRAT